MVDCPNALKRRIGRSGDDTVVFCRVLHLNNYSNSKGRGSIAIKLVTDYMIAKVRNAIKRTIAHKGI